MSASPDGVSRAFQTFLDEAPGQAEAWLGAARRLEEATALDEKTLHLAYLAVLAAMRLQGGLPAHVQLAREAGASRAEIASAVLVGLPAAGNMVIQSLPIALAAYDAAERSSRDGQATARTQPVRPGRRRAQPLQRGHSKRSASMGSRREAFRAG